MGKGIEGNEKKLEKMLQICKKMVSSCPSASYLGISPEGENVQASDKCQNSDLSDEWDYRDLNL